MSIEEKLTTVVENVPKVYEAGQKSEYDRFWDAYQNKGKDTDHTTKFAGAAWNNNTFKPKYSMYPTNAYMMFRYSKILHDLAEYLSNLGVTLDFSNSTNCQYAFYGSYFKRVGVINISKASASNVTSMFDYAPYIETVDRLIVNESQAITFFAGTSRLANIEIEGTIGRNVTFAASPLTPKSMKSIISHLKNYAGTSSEYAYTVRFTEDCWTNLEADSVAPDGGTWTNYVRSLGYNT